jgi:hypothetical protein
MQCPEIRWSPFTGEGSHETQDASAGLALDRGDDLTVRQLALLANLDEASTWKSLAAEGIRTHLAIRGLPSLVSHN